MFLSLGDASEPGMSKFDAGGFREALGQFATGVTVVTTVGSEGEPVGVTASSFNSVSLLPPMILWSLARNARSETAFSSFGYFAVHVLGVDQQNLSDHFSRAGAEKFNGVDFYRHDNGLPLLDKYAARFICKTAYQYAGGDHLIFVGEVLDYECAERPPLLFHGGSYKSAAQLLVEPA